MKLIGMEFIREIVETALLTCRLKYDPTVSLLLIAGVGEGKSSVATQKICPAVVELTDLTAVGMYKAIEHFPDAEFFVIDDLTVLSGKKSHVRHNAIGVLSALIEQGVRVVVSPAGVLDFTKANKGRPVQKGIIACITKNVVGDDSAWWNKTGFSSRLLPISYQHSQELEDQIREFIYATARDLWIKSDYFKMAKRLRVVTFPVNLHQFVRIMVKGKQPQLGDDVPYRLDLHYISMLKAHALLHERVTVKQTDVNFLEKMNDYVGLKPEREI